MSKADYPEFDIVRHAGWLHKVFFRGKRDICHFTGGKDSCKAYVSRFNEHGRNFNFGGVGK